MSELLARKIEEVFMKLEKFYLLKSSDVPKLNQGTIVYNYLINFEV